jgi:hypothetical protein
LQVYYSELRLDRYFLKGYLCTHNNEIVMSRDIAGQR